MLRGPHPNSNIPTSMVRDRVRVRIGVGVRGSVPVGTGPIGFQTRRF